MKNNSKDKIVYSSLGLIFVVLGILTNQWMIALLFTVDSKIDSIIYKVYIALFNLSAIYLGATLLFKKNRTDLFKCIFIIFILVTSTFCLLATSELTIYTVYDKKNIINFYTEFTKQHLHPFYYFFFPQDHRTIQKINNDVVSITSNGFRGGSPGEKGERELAFIVGGSAAFGHGSTSDNTTISGYLNSLQSRYYFVNAGVPSWNSTQEFYRISLQLLNYDPSLIIAYDGYNDAVINYVYQDTNYPPGTPESYNYFENWFDDIRASEGKHPLINVNLNFLKFKRTDRLLMNLFSNQNDSLPETMGSFQMIPLNHHLLEVAMAGAIRYVKNVELMKKILAAYNINFLCIYQPSRSLHKKNNYIKGRKKVRAFQIEFHNNVFENSDSLSLNIYDFSNLFDQYYDRLDSNENIFIDDTHLTDQGNLIISKEIVEILYSEELLE